MAEIGIFNTLHVTKQVAFGVYLDAGELGEVLLPRLDVPADCKVGSELEVFLYMDSEDRPIATTRRPRAQRGQCVSLQVVQVNHAGAFLDWGLPKDLLVPFGEQRVPMREGQSYVVYVYLDKPSGRLVATSRLDTWLNEDGTGFEPMQQVNLLIYARTDMGFKAVINQTHLGLIFKTEVLQPLRVGQKVKGYIRRVREDGRIDLCLQLQGQEVRDELSEQILEHLRDNNGVSSLCDRSTPEEIFAVYKVSKGNYKKAVGALLKKKLIVVEPHQIRLV
ncbi:MAG: S1-like domain-containing RNA-binding protein [Gammaproteobacteria bacterium]|nr:S1-like domain-containing RNA-binding protein [Gammaproteobacteria bacterium]MDP2348038.1 S1-like domain-containing RNA-binding protein [Gammaproteobacteria bacterium]